MAGAVVGALMGYPLSYFFQAGALRAKLSLGEYIQHINDVLNDGDLGPTAIITVVGCAVGVAIVGWATGPAPALAELE